MHDRPSGLRYRRGFVERAELQASRVPALLPILTELTPLRELRISFDTGAEELGDVPGLMDLEGLSVQGERNGDDPVRAFASWSHRGRLRMLHLGNLTSRAVGSAVASLPALAGLESLSLGTIADEDLVALAAAAHLARLRQLRLKFLPPRRVRVSGALRIVPSACVLSRGRTRGSSMFLGSRLPDAGGTTCFRAPGELGCWGPTPRPGAPSGSRLVPGSQGFNSRGEVEDAAAWLRAGTGW